MQVMHIDPLRQSSHKMEARIGSFGLRASRAWLDMELVHVRRTSTSASVHNLLEFAPAAGILFCIHIQALEQAVREGLIGDALW